MHKYIEYIEDYNEYYVINDFLSDKADGVNRQSWTPLIPAISYRKAIDEFTKYGKFINFPTKLIYQWMGIIMKNTAILRANTNWAGHSTNFPYEEFVDTFFPENEEAEEQYYNNYTKCGEYLDKIGLYDWMIMPDGSDAWSDYGIEPAEKLITSYDSNMSPEELIVLINRILDVYHARGDLSSIFIEGGNKTLSTISNGGMIESKKRIRITESQLQEYILNKKRLNEAMDNEFSLDVLKSLPSFNQRLKYCRQHLGNPIGKGSSRIVFQISDEKVLKLAMNEKGIAQNEVEADWGAQQYGVVPKLYDVDNNNLFIVVEYVLPAKKQDFPVCIGIKFEKFIDFVKKVYLMYASNRDRRVVYSNMSDNEFENLVDNNEWLDSFYRYMSDFGVPYSDLTVMRNYGLCERNGEPEIVLLDSGLTDAIWDEFYKKR